MQSIKVDLTITNKDTPKYHVHKLPCTINYNGHANVQKYFIPTIKTEDEKIYTSTLRGRPLQGKLTKLPDNTMGFVISKDGSKQWRTQESFDKFMNWTLDSNPNLERNLNGSLLWLELSDAIHEPVTKEEMEEMNKSPN